MSRIRKIYNYTYYFFRKYILKFFLRSVLILLGLNLLLILIANIPAVQTSMANRLVDYLEEKTGYPIDIRAASLNWFDELRLEGVDIRDLKNRSFIQVEELAIDFDIFALYKDNQIILDHAAIRGADVWVHEQDSTLDYSISEWTDALELALSDSIPADSLPTSSTAQPFYFLIKSVDLANSSFTLRHPSEEPLEGFDYMNFTLNDINLRLKKMEVIGGAFQTIIQRLSCVDSKTGIKVHNLSTFYRTSGHDMLYKNLDMKVGKSHIKGGMDWRYNDYEDFGDFYHKIRIKGWLEKTDVYSKDIGLFNEFMNFLPVSDYLVSGKFDGTVKNFTVEDFILKHRNSEIRANFNMYGLPDASETFMDVRLAPSEIVTSDLNTFFEIGSSIYNRLGKTTLNGSISGFLSDVVANLSLKSSIGKINTDLNIKVPLNDEEISYSGSLATEGFNLSQLLLLPVNTENMYLNGTLKGSGTSMETVKIDFDSRIDSVRLNQYTLTSAHIKTNLQQQRFDGNFEIEDPALSASVSMTANISPQTAGLNLTGDFKHIDFQALKFARYPAKLSTKLRIKLKGNEIDNTKGYIRFNNSQVGYKNRYLDIQKINLYSQVKNKNRTFELTSDFLDFYTHGNFKPSFLAQEIPVLFKSYQLELSNRRKALDSLLARQKRPADSLSLDFQLYLKNTSPLLELSESSLRVGKSSRFQGKINGADTLRISFQAYSDSLMHSGNIYEDVNFEMESQRPFNGSNTSTRITLTSDKQSFGDYLTTRHFITEWIWEKDKLNFFLETESEKSGIDLELNGTAEYQPNQSILHLNAPKLQIFNRNWKIASENKIKLNNNEISFQNVALYSGDELISLNGSVSPDRKKELALLVNELDLSALNLVSDHKIKGKLYASGTLKNLYGKPQITSSLEVNNINIDSTSIGNLSLLTHWNNVDSSFNVFGNLSQKKLELIDIQGQYTPHNGGILFEGAIHQIPFSYLTPFTKDYISQPEGQLKGHLMLSGHLDRPILKGYLSLDQTRLRVNYTNTDYEINGRVNINENLVNIESLTIKDNNFKTGSLKGSIKHSNFTDYQFQLNGQLDELNLLNTRDSEEEIFYGKLFASGDFSLTGKLSELQFQSNLSTKTGSRIFIKMFDEDVAIDQSYIQFTSLKKKINRFASKKKKENVKKPIEITGVQAQMRLNVDPDTEFTILRDPEAKDIIHAQGNGDLLLSIDRAGDMQLFGTYELTKGKYNFTYQNIINKEFIIEPKSSLTWNGDPSNAIVDLTAQYKTNTSLAVLMDQSFREAPEIRRTYPTTVNLFLTGSLQQLNPIEFGIDIEGYPENITYNGESISLGANIRAFEKIIEIDKQELTRQVVSLFVLHSFSPLNAFNVDAGATLSTSLSEFITNQIGYLLSQYDENLEIQVDLGNLSQAQLDDFRLRLSYSFLNGRIKLVRDGSLTDADQKTSFYSVLGDITIEFAILEDQRLKAKIYNRKNLYHLSNAVIEDNPYNIGTSLQYGTDFDNLWELLGIKKSKKNETE